MNDIISTGEKAQWKDEAEPSVFKHFFIELLDIECALCHVTGVQFDKTFALINPPFWIFFKNYRLLLHKMSWGELILPYKSAILWRQFFDWHEIGARILCLLFLWFFPVEMTSFMFLSQDRGRHLCLWRQTFLRTLAMHLHYKSARLIAVTKQTWRVECLTVKSTLSDTPAEICQVLCFFHFIILVY